MWATLKVWHGNTFTKFNIVTEQIYEIHENKATQNFSVYSICLLGQV